MKQLLSVFIVLLLLTAPIRAADYVIEEMREEGSPAPPFSIARVEPFPDGLRLFLSTEDIAASPAWLPLAPWKANCPTTKPRQKPVLPSRWVRLPGAPRIANPSTLVTPKRCRLAPILASPRSVSSTS